MYKRILVPVDGSETCRKALTAALNLARESDGRVRVVHALDELASTLGFEAGVNIVSLARAYADKVLSEALEMAQAAGVPADGRLAESRGERLGDAVAREALDWKADLVVLGTHGRRGVHRVLLGSGAEQIVRMAPVPVLTIRGSDEKPR
ncbi:MAG TPA: universal stress protein [Ramlibacter sp.]|nr:universal stress protein [Ramlibacter sp.]